MDNLGNKEIIHSTDIFIDDLPPQSNLSFNGPHLISSSIHIITPSTELNLSAIDDGCGLSEIWYWLDSENHTLYRRNFTVSELGNITLYWFCKDYLNNSENNY